MIESDPIQFLSDQERLQLDTQTMPTSAEWRELRHFVSQRDLGRRPQTNPRLMAYTPGETLRLFDEPEVRDWHADMRNYKLPDECQIVCFVPCAATKPWHGARRGVYKSYNQLQQERDQGSLTSFHFVTLSEPLGIVPEEHWLDFPQYENPGLFKGHFLRVGMTKQELREQVGRDVRLPFDDEGYRQAIEHLGDVIATFIENNRSEKRVFASFVEGFSEKTTHSAMLDYAASLSDGLPVSNRFHKRAAPRQSPYEYVKQNILELASTH